MSIVDSAKLWARNHIKNTDFPISVDGWKQDLIDAYLAGVQQSDKDHADNRAKNAR